jgi:hypothetical protein
MIYSQTMACHVFLSFHFQCLSSGGLLSWVCFPLLFTSLCFWPPFRFWLSCSFCGDPSWFGHSLHLGGGDCSTKHSSLPCLFLTTHLLLCCCCCPMPAFFGVSGRLFFWGFGLSGLSLLSLGSKKGSKRTASSFQRVQSSS